MFGTVGTMRRIVTAIAVLLAATTATLTVGAVPAGAVDFCSNNVHADSSDLATVGDGQALPVNYIPGGVGARTPSPTAEVRWEVPPSPPQTELEDITELSYRSYRQYVVGSPSTHVTGVAVKLLSGVVLRWYPTPGPAGFWQTYNLATSPQFALWKAAFGTHRVVSYGLVLGPNTAGAEARFDTVTYRGARNSCRKDAWTLTGGGGHR